MTADQAEMIAEAIRASVLLAVMASLAVSLLTGGVVDLANQLLDQWRAMRRLAALKRRAARVHL
ncbi:MAG: hypothetical protein DI635_04075 [Pseudoxanthomonas suwonensis]|nr:MAG: hypothetical protein DI635_04075 [Pseudoxanthomonas suwonensis]